MNAEARRDALCATALAAAAIGLHLLYWNRGFILLDEGYVATIGDLVARGGAVYRDAVAYALPGSFALLAAAFRVAGTSLLVSRGLTVALCGILTALIYRLARAALSSGAAFLAASGFIVLSLWAYPQWQVFGYQQPALTAVVAAAALLARPDVARRPLRVLLAGLLAGAAVSGKQTYATSAALFAVFLAVDGFSAPRRERAGLRPALWFACGAAIPVGITLAAMAASGSLGDFYVQGVLSPLYGDSYGGYVGLPPPWPLLGQDPRVRGALVHYVPPLILDLQLPALLASWLYRETSLVDAAIKVLFWLPVVVLLLAALRLALELLRGGWSGGRGAALLWAADLGLLLGVNRPLDWMHVSFGFVGTVWLGVWLIAPAPGRRGATRSAAQRRSPQLAALAVVLALALLGALALIRDLRRAASEPVALPRAPVLARAADAKLMREVVGAIQRATAPGEPILVLPYQPLIYFLADRAPASRFLLVWPVEYQRGRDAEMLQAIDRAGVRTVIYGSTGAPQLGTLAANAPQLLAGLTARFRVAEVLGEERWGPAFARLEPRPATPAGTVELAPSGAARVTAGQRVALEPSAISRATTWPFERVLAVRPTPGGFSELRFALPEGTAGDVVLGYGMNPDHWVAEKAVPVSFSAALERDGEEQALFSEERDPQAKLADRAWAWRRVSVDGSPATLVLRLSTPPEMAEGDDAVGWAVPRLEPTAPPAG